MMSEYLIWSNEHRAWWKPSSQGYTTELSRAGRYSRDEAISICANARDRWGAKSIPSEIPVVARDVHEAEERDTQALAGLKRKQDAYQEESK